MRPPYISLFAIMIAAVLSGCSSVPDIKDPHSLASRVGNFSPTKLENDKAERQAARLVTPLAKGIRDLDGNQENFDPAFGSPEADSEHSFERQRGDSGLAVSQIPSRRPDFGAAQQALPTQGAVMSIEDRAPLMPPERATQSTPSTRGGTLQSFNHSHQVSPLQEGTRQTGIAAPRVSDGSLRGDKISQSQRFAEIASSGERSSPRQNKAGQSYSTQTNSATSVSPAAFGNAEDGRPTAFVTARPTLPIADLPPPPSMRSGTVTNQFPIPTAAVSDTAAQTNSQGFGCPPAGMMSLNSSSGGSYGDKRSSLRPQPVVTYAPAQRQPAQAPSQPLVDSYRYQGRGVLPNSARSPAGTDDADVINAQANRARDVQVTITARVKRLLPDDRKGNPHQRFLLELSNGTTVLVAHNIDLAPYVPLQEGDMVTICGEYIWNEKGGVLHYTHHTTNSRHRGGYIEYNRQTYQ